MPLVNGIVVLGSGIGAAPGGIGDLVPQFSGADGFHRFGIAAFGFCCPFLDTAVQVPVAVVFHGFHEGIGDAHRVIAVLATHRVVGLGVPVGVVGIEIDVGVTLAGQLKNALNVVLRHVVATGLTDGFCQFLVFKRIAAHGTVVGPAFDLHRFVGQFDYILKMLFAVLRPGNKRGYFLLFEHFPVDVFFDVGVIEVERNHFGCPSGGSARLDGTCCPVAYLQKTHQAR